MITTDAGLAWLDALADRYDSAAREIRAARASIAALEVMSASTAAETEAAELADGDIGTAEAVRRVLGEARGQPLRPREIIARMQRLRWRTLSKHPSSVVSTALNNLQQQRLARRTPAGWVSTLATERVARD